MTTATPPKFKFANYLWDDEKATALTRATLGLPFQPAGSISGSPTPAEETLLPSSPNAIRSPASAVEVLWVKGSGGDLRTSALGNFASLYQEKLLSLRKLYASMERPGPKTAAEDKMVGCYPHCTYNLNARAASIDTPLHSFVPFAHGRPHASELGDCRCRGAAVKELTKDIFGGEIGWTPWLRPGFELGLELQRICGENPRLKGVIPWPAWPHPTGPRTTNSAMTSLSNLSRRPPSTSTIVTKGGKDVRWRKTSASQAGRTR